MSRPTRCFALCALLFAPAALAGGPKLVDEKRIFPEGDQSWYNERTHWPWMMRLSPDGKHLLCLKRLAAAQPADANRPRSSEPSWQIRLRELATGKDTVLLEAWSAWETVYTRFDLFDPSGKTLLMPKHTQIKKPETAQMTAVEQRMELLLYDVASGKITRTPLAGARVWAKFDRTGKRLILNHVDRSGEGMDEAGPIIYTATLPKLELKPLRARGFPYSVCPTADVVNVFAPPKRVRRDPGDPRAKRPEPKLILYDFAADKQLAELPSEKPSSSWHDWESQWTADGRYLYYPGAKDDTVQTPEGPRQQTATLSCIWDRIAGKRIATIDSAVAVGPGPTPTTMVLGSRGPEQKGMILHDAASGKSWTLDPNVRVQHALGGAVVYIKPAPDGKEAAYVARIVMAADAKPSGR